MSYSSHYTDLKLACNQLVVLVSEIKSIYERVLAEKITIATACGEIRALLGEHNSERVPHKTDIVSLFPEGDLFVHINQTYYAPSSVHEYHVNLNFTLTPSPSGHRSVLLVHPNVVVNDAVTDLFDLAPLQFTVRPIFKGRDVTQECLQKEHHVEWSLRETPSTTGPKYLKVHPGDRIIFHARDGLDYTVTSCNSRYEVPINPPHDLILLDGNQSEIILTQPGDYYFISRPHNKRLQLYVHVKSCPYH
jgi:plastocyanin